MRTCDPVEPLHCLKSSDVVSHVAPRHDYSTPVKRLGLITNITGHFSYKKVTGKY